MRIALGADHGGFPLKGILAKFLADEGHEVLDCGTHSTDAVDYPDIAVLVGAKVQSGEADLGLMVDGAGIGSAMALNRMPGVLAAVCSDHFVTRNAREHNNANVMTLGSMVVGPGFAKELVKLFVSTPFAGGRHEKRVNKIHQVAESSGRLSLESIRRVVAEIVARVLAQGAPAAAPPSAPAAPGAPPAPKARSVRRVVSQEDVRVAARDGVPIVCGRGSIVTDLARECARDKGVTITVES